MTIHIIHGLHSCEQNKSTPALLIPEIEAEGLDYEIHDYGYALAITARCRNPARAEMIARRIEPGDCIIAHSNGCAIVSIMLNLGIAPRVVVFLQPALEDDTIFPDGNYVIKVFHNENDMTAIASKLLFWFHHPFGAMGAFGYRGNDRRITNYDTMKMFGLGGHIFPYHHGHVRRKVVRSMKENSGE